MARHTSTSEIKNVEILKNEYFTQVEKNTPAEIKGKPIFDLDNGQSFSIRLTKELIDRYNIRDWFRTYKKEALVSTAGIRGAQNVLYPWDTRFPLNEMGVALATLGKAMVLKDAGKKRIDKICAGEVRYNTGRYMEIISRIQAAQGIHTHMTTDGSTTAIWMVSFLTFMNDFDGGEYVTSSHAMSSKTATKDLDSQGSQFIPEMSAMFVEKIEMILTKAEKEGFEIIFSEKSSPLIHHDIDGIVDYYDYLRKGIATDNSLGLIKEQIKQGMEIMYDTTGGSMYGIMEKLFKKLGIFEAFVFNNAEQDPFFHGIGKLLENPITKKKQFFDWGCDTTMTQVIVTVGYDTLLKDKPIGYVVIMVDPDGDRIVLGQVESSSRKAKLDDLGIRYFDINPDKVFTYYTANQAFFLIMNYHHTQLVDAGLWDDFPRTLITTTPSAETWVEWAKKVGINVISVPVGFKEIATIMKKIEKSMLQKPDDDVVIRDIYGRLVNLGTQPRLHFAGEESAGMIIGPEEPIKSKKGRIAISMREKSAAEASVITTAMVSSLHRQNKLISEYTEDIFRKYGIKWKYDVRIDRRLYNESNPDPIELKKEKAEGEKIRDLVDNFYLAIALSLRLEKITLKQAKEILSEALPELDFSNLENLYFVGDGSYFRFPDKYVEIRKSGTDAILKGYAAGTDKKECIRYAEKMSYYSGNLTPKFRKHINMDIYQDCQEIGAKILREWQKEGL